MSQPKPKAIAVKSGRLNMLDDAVALGDDLTACVIRAFISNDRRRGPGRSTAHYSKLADSLALAAKVPESLMYAMMNWMPARHEVACSKEETIQNENMNIPMPTYVFGVSTNTFRTFHTDQVPLAMLELVLTVRTTGIARLRKLRFPH